MNHNHGWMGGGMFRWMVMAVLVLLVPIGNLDRK